MLPDTEHAPAPSQASFYIYMASARPAAQCPRFGTPQIGLSPAHGLLGVAGEDGRLECFDPRQRAAVGTLDAAAAAGAVRTQTQTLINYYLKYRSFRPAGYLPKPAMFPLITGR